MAKTVLVTGSAKGLGRFLAVELAKKGFNVIVHYYKSEKEAQEVVKDINKMNKEFESFAVQADLRDEKQVKEMFSFINEKADVDILINNVGNFFYKNINELTEEEFKDVIENNLYSVFFCCRNALPSMRKKKFGRIINLGCIGCDQLTIRKNTTPYYIAKTGVLMLSRNLAMEEKEKESGVTVNVISPGVLESSVVKPEGAPVVRFEDILDAVMFLISEKSANINGVNTEVSKGWKPEGYG